MNLTLGRLIEKLKLANLNAEVIFDFCGFVPTSFKSWRGAYSELALGHRERNGEPVTVKQLLESAIAANGARFIGYKGGEYTMGLDTPLWVDNYGYSTRTALTDVLLESDYRYL